MSQIAPKATSRPLVRILADIVDEGQARGEIAEQGRPENLRTPKVFTLDELGIERPRLTEARVLRERRSAWS